jgi:hypothetical protein
LKKFSPRTFFRSNRCANKNENIYLFVPILLREKYKLVRPSLNQHNSYFTLFAEFGNFISHTASHYDTRERDGFVAAFVFGSLFAQPLDFVGGHFFGYVYEVVVGILCLDHDKAGLFLGEVRLCLLFFSFLTSSSSSSSRFSSLLISSASYPLHTLLPCHRENMHPGNKARNASLVWLSSRHSTPCEATEWVSGSSDGVMKLGSW